MYRNGFLFRGLSFLILVALLVGGGFMAFRAGWGQGYFFAQSGERVMPIPWVAGGNYTPLLVLGIVILLGMIISQIGRYFFWKKISKNFAKYPFQDGSRHFQPHKHGFHRRTARSSWRVPHWDEDPEERDEDVPEGKSEG
jgi:hypothetical protein